MTAELKDWQQQLLQLRAAGRRLSETMAQATVDLREQGWEPTESLLQQMQQFRNDFHRLRDAILAGRQDDAARIDSLDALATELARREVIATALERVHHAARLRSRNGDAGSPMFVRWQHEVSTVQAELSTATPPESLVESLQSGRHPLVVAVRLVEAADDFNDDDWGNAMETVTSTLGRDFATALARGRLTLEDERIEADSIH